MDRVQGESIRLLSPDLADILVRCEPVEGLKPAREIVGRHEVRKVRAQLVMAVVVEAFDGRLLDGAVHPFDLPVGPWMVGFGQPVLNPVGLTDHVETHGAGISGVPVPGLLSELNSVVSQDGMNLIRHGIEHMLQELPGRLPVSLLDELGHGKFALAVDANEQKELSFHSLYLGNVDVEKSNWIAFELRPPRLVASDIRQARDAMTLQTAVQRRACQVRDGRLERGSDGPVFISSTVARFRHFATVLGLISSSLLSVASEACDRCIAALTACVVVPLP